MKLDSIRELLQLLGEIDLDEMDIDVERSSRVTARHIRSRERRNQSSRKSHKNRTNRGKSKNTGGREKFARKRKIKRLNRLLKQAERNGEDITDLLSDEDPSIHISQPQADRVEVMIDRHPVDVEFEEGDTSIDLSYKESSTTVELPAPPVTLREKKEQNFVTTLLFETKSQEE
jgi:hypothetical protein|uniref:Uncharacterized protein n=1 Tax=uncultured haloarchaeon TaxID=160804 RepID=A5YSZ2_9EURY|nr:hypothetical protein [uncultured haloarchaeon]